MKKFKPPIWDRLFKIPFCKNYWKDFPKVQESGKFIAEAIRSTPISSGVVFKEREIDNIQEAYHKARMMALKLSKLTFLETTGTYDYHVPAGEYPNSIGIEWIVKEDKNDSDR